ncbi:MAG: hypothetical protein PHD83_01895 [Caldisericia bacterium]|nr:hypothetical protein [Caldisericia bacterium]
MPGLHGSFDTCFENACGKCLQFGFTIRDNILKKALDPYRQWFLTLPLQTSEISFSYDFYRNLLAFHLFRAGYEDREIVDTIHFRIKQVHDFVIQDRYDIYISSEGFPSMPKNFQKRPFVDPALFQNGISIFPNIHDVLAFRSYYQKMASIEEKDMIRRIIKYIADPRYQTIQEGYGVMFAPPRSYYSIGWSVHFHSQNQLFGYAFCNAFPTYRSSKTGKETLRIMESYQLPTLLYDFPSDFLQEKTGYLVSGSHMGMGVNRRNKTWRQLESSFWMLFAHQ